MIRSGNNSFQQLGVLALGLVFASVLVLGNGAWSRCNVAQPPVVLSPKTDALATCCCDPVSSESCAVGPSCCCQAAADAALCQPRSPISPLAFGNGSTIELAVCLLSPPHSQGTLPFGLDRPHRLLVPSGTRGEVPVHPPRS